jgi:hypothetical protein
MSMEVLFPPFRLDLAGGRLWKGEREIRLRPKTFAVLRYLRILPGSSPATSPRDSRRFGAALRLPARCATGSRITSLCAGFTTTIRLVYASNDREVPR